jgi:hypothetical protein
VFISFIAHCPYLSYCMYSYFHINLLAIIFIHVLMSETIIKLHVRPISPKSGPFIQVHNLYFPLLKYLRFNVTDICLNTSKHPAAKLSKFKYKDSTCPLNMKWRTTKLNMMLPHWFVIFWACPNLC